MTESELYKELGALTKAKDQWEEKIPYVTSLLAHESEKIQAKALWLLAEMGFAYPQSVRDAVSAIASFCNSPQTELYLGFRKHRHKHAGYLWRPHTRV